MKRFEEFLSFVEIFIFVPIIALYCYDEGAELLTVPDTASNTIGFFLLIVTIVALLFIIASAWGDAICFLKHIVLRIPRETGSENKQ